MENNNTTTTVWLSQEEIAFILKALDLPDLPGVQAVDLENEEILGATGRALIARGLLTASDGEPPLLDSGLAATLTLCAYPSQMSTIVHQDSHALPQQRYYYRTNEFAAEQTSPLYGVHAFGVRNVSDLGEEFLGALLADGSSELQTPTFVIENVVLDAVHKKSKTTPKDAISLLIESDLPFKYAEIFVNTLTGFTRKILLQCTYQLSPELKQKFVTFFVGEKSCWTVETNAKNINQVLLRSVPTEQISQFIYELYKPYC